MGEGYRLSEASWEVVMLINGLDEEDDEAPLTLEPDLLTPWISSAKSSSFLIGIASPSFPPVPS